MKNLALVFASLFLTSLLSSQCSPPEVLEWSFSDEYTVDIVIEADENTDSYELTFFALYDDNVIAEIDSTTFLGTLAPGIQTVTHSLEDLFSSVMSTDPQSYYYEALISGGCDMENSSSHHFYVSPLSLLGDDGYVQSDLHFNVVTFLPDGNGDTYETTVEVPASYAGEAIDSIFVLLDIGHTYNGDLSIELTSPSGVMVELLAAQNGLGGSKGFSVLFKDGAPQIETTSPDDAYTTVKGEYSPNEPLETFVGDLIAGTWTISITDNLSIDYGYLFGVGLYFNTSPCVATIGGKSYFDYNENNVQDGVEPAYPYAALAGSTFSNIVYMNSDGTYARCVDAGTSTLGMIGLPQYYSAEPSSYDLDIAEGDFFTAVDFALQADIDVVDISVDMFSLTPDRPGFDNIYYVNYDNIGTLCVDEFLLSVTLDDNIIIDSVDDDEVSIVGNTLTRTVSDLCPFQEGGFQIGITVPETMMIGDTLVSSVSATDLEQDIDSSNNSDLMENIVVASYDPNDITVDLEKISPQYNGTGAELEYRIRFQNTGNYQAERVLVIDSLPDELDITTITILDASHEMTLSSLEHVLYFDFQDIGLPDETSDPIGSNGFVRFKVTNMGATEIGDIIENTAEIYFDFNPAIITNTAETEVDESILSISDHLAGDIGLFPNPATEMVNLSWPNELDVHQLRIVDAMGREVRRISISASERSVLIDVSDLASGRYEVMASVRDRDMDARRTLIVGQR